MSEAFTYDGVVYLFSVPSGAFKIGLTQGDPTKRLKELQVGNHERIKFVGATLPGYRGNSDVSASDMEKSLHDRLAKYCVGGEWFHAPEEVVLEAWSAAYGNPVRLAAPNSETYKYRDPEKRRAYMRDYMRKRRAKETNDV